MPQKLSTSKTYHLAHKIRHNPSKAESRLWSRLRAHQLEDVHFRRQHAIAKYIVDFCAPRQKLIIELDGSQHLDCEEQDQERTSFLNAKGYRVIRFWNDEVANDLDGVIIAIQQALTEADNNQSPPPASPILISKWVRGFENSSPNVPFKNRNGGGVLRISP
jgi:very-short-patch-repair endonuclease